MYCKNFYLVFFLVCIDWFFFLNYLICDNYFLDLWINQISTGNLVKPSNYWCFNWFMTPKSHLIRLNDLIIRWLCKCVLSWIYFSGAICTVVCPHCENDNEWKQIPCSFIVYEPKIKEIYSFLWWNLSKFHVLQSVNYILITIFSFYQPKPIFFGGNYD